MPASSEGRWPRDRTLIPHRYIIILDFNNDAWELHHYLIAWIGTLFCAFDHPASVVCLAITTGIFVQGLAAYGPAEISAGPYAARPWTKIPVVMARQTTEAGWSKAQNSVPIHAMR